VGGLRSEEFPGSLTPTEAVALQRELARRVTLVPCRGPLRYVAGVDVASALHGDTLWGAIVVVDRRTGSVVEEQVASAPASFPYVPGLLSFREVPVILAAARRVRTTPDAILVDGQGLAHPRRLGIACHLGLLWGIPTVGCAKSRLVGETRGPLGTRRGSWRTLYDRGEAVGVLLRTRESTSPLWVSPGHLVDTASARRVTLACASRYRLPDPTRLAHILAGRARRGAAGGAP
jgi:deoxyribonuclease V